MNAAVGGHEPRIAFLAQRTGSPDFDRARVTVAPLPGGAEVSWTACRVSDENRTRGRGVYRGSLACCKPRRARRDLSIIVRVPRLTDGGRFDAFGEGVPGGELNELFERTRRENSNGSPAAPWTRRPTCRRERIHRLNGRRPPATCRQGRAFPVPRLARGSWSPRVLPCRARSRCSPWRGG
jgi:hypothetical protein